MRLVAPDDLSQVWEFVEKGLNVILTHGECWWTPADVKRILREGKAWLFVEDKGFLTVERCLAPNSEPYLNVWHMYFEPGQGVKRKRELIAFLDQLKKDAKCEWIQFAGRPEWRGMIEGDFELHTTIWRRK